MLANQTGDLVLEVRTFPDAGRGQARVWTFRTLEQFREGLSNLTGDPSVQHGLGAFYSVHPRHGVARGTGGKDEDVRFATCLFLDFDGKDYAPGDLGKQAALDAVDQLPIQPSAVIDSGGGYHVYYFLDEPWEFGSKEVHAEVIYGMASEFGADLVVRNPSRVLRIPGTYHLKDPENPRLVQIIRWAPDRRYPSEEFLDYRKPIPAKNSAAKVELGAAGPAPVLDELPVHPFYREVIRTGDDPKKKQWRRGQSLDRSVRDFSVIRALLRRGVAPSVIRDVFTHYPVGDKYREKDDRYLTLTIQNALGTLEDRKHPEQPQIGLSLTHLYAYMPEHKYIFRRSREIWPASSVNSRIPPIPYVDAEGKPKSMKANVWLDKNRPVEQMTWAPGQPEIIEDRLVSDGGWIREPGFRTYNLYRKPQIEQGDPKQAERWLDHVARVYDQDTAHLILWFAHRVQRPFEKINHALVLGGGQGIGKDTILEPVKQAIGPWNFAEVSPVQLIGKFNSFLKSVILRISEARDLGEMNRYAFYDHTKTYTAAPPDVLRCNEKNIREYSIFNVCGVVITTNYKTDGIYLDADDRRHFVAWSNLTRDSFAPRYWTDLYRWYDTGGHAHVTAYLLDVDLSHFDPKAPPPKTEAFFEIVDANRSPEDAEFADVLDALCNPPAITLAAVRDNAGGSFGGWIDDRKNRRQIPHRLEAAGYSKTRNPSASDGLWRIRGKRQAIYARNSLTRRDQLAAAQELAEGER